MGTGADEFQDPPVASADGDLVLTVQQLVEQGLDKDDIDKVKTFCGPLGLLDEDGVFSLPMGLSLSELIAAAMETPKTQAHDEVHRSPH